jgi:hypothetical protein
MAKNWQIFETEACKFLTENIKIKDVKFLNIGMSHPINSDIKVILKDKFLFNIEAKLSPSQSGQIAVLEKDGKYFYSTKSKEPENDIVKKIIQHLNNNLEKYQNCGTNAIVLDIDNEILARWVEEHYKVKNVKFVVTSDKPKNFDKNFIRVLGLEDVRGNFKIVANLRRKRSGTAKIPSKDLIVADKLLKGRFGKNYKLLPSGLLILKEKPNDYYLGDRYYISEKEDNHSVRKRSQTNNINIVFSIIYTGNKETLGLELLGNEIKKLIN